MLIGLCMVVFAYLLLKKHIITPIVDTDGSHFWFKYGKLHRDDDLPAIVYVTGDQVWYQDGKLHRDGNLPAYVSKKGNHLWCQYGKLHRDGDRPAVEYELTPEWFPDTILLQDVMLNHSHLPLTVTASRGRGWFKHGELHRDRDRPAYVSVYGDQIWAKYNKLHRDKGPAIMYQCGYQEWYKNGKPHRDVGPAMNDRFEGPHFYEHGIRRTLESIRGETLVGLALVSWSPGLFFV